MASKPMTVGAGPKDWKLLIRNCVSFIRLPDDFLTSGTREHTEPIELKLFACSTDLA